MKSSEPVRNYKITNAFMNRQFALIISFIFLPLIIPRQTEFGAQSTN